MISRDSRQIWNSCNMAQDAFQDDPDAVVALSRSHTIARRYLPGQRRRCPEELSVLQSLSLFSHGSLKVIVPSCKVCYVLIVLLHVFCVIP